MHALSLRLRFNIVSVFDSLAYKHLYSLTMDMKEAVGAVMREYLVPELESIKAGQLRADVEFAAINKRLDDVNKRLDDVNQHLTDQSRRIDAVREELGQRIDETNKRIDVTNNRMDKLYDVIVRRDEHSAVVIKLNALEQDIRELQLRFVA